MWKNIGAVLAIISIAVIAGGAGDLTGLTGAGGRIKASGGGGAYVGPGDVSGIGTPDAWWGLRAYSAAKAGTKVANICDTATLAVCTNVNSLANGNFDVATASALTQCSVSCSVKILYDQSGQTHCVAAACDLTANSTNAPVLTFNCLGSLPCLTFTGTAPSKLTSGSPDAFSTSFTMYIAAKRTANLTSAHVVLQDTAACYFSATANNMEMFNGTVQTKPYPSGSDPKWTATQCIFDSTAANQTLYIDGTANSVNAGAGSTTGTFTIGTDNGGGNPLTGTFFEAGMFQASFTTGVGGTADHMNSNIHTYWGF